MTPKTMLGAIGALVLAMIAARALTAGDDARPSDAALRAHVDTAMDGLREEAKRRHPQVPESEALRQVAEAQAVSSLAGKDAQARARSAANYFYGFYTINTRARPEYCRAHGVDLAPFVRAFDAVHGADLARARVIHAQAGVDPESVMPVLAPQLARAAATDMADVARAGGVDAAGACRLFNDRAAEIAAAIVLPPELKRALAP